MSQRVPICEAIENFCKVTDSRWHTPGHSGGAVIPDALKSWGHQVWQYDVTEVEGLDYLLDKTGVIAEAEQLTAKAYGVTDTMFLTQGSTAGIQSAILATVKPGQKILVQRHSHISIWNSLVLSGAEPIWLLPEYDKWGLVKAFDVKEIELKLAANPDIAAVVLQNPTYEGRAGDIIAAVNAVHSFNIPLIVDEAHGAHWHFCDRFPVSGVDAGADIVIQSAHKTLPVLTGGAWVHSQGSIIDQDRLVAMSRLIHSSSPSYLLMASLDACRAHLAEQAPAGYLRLFEMVQRFHQHVKQSPEYRVLPLNLVHHDFSKINVHFLSQSSEFLLNTTKKYGIMFEKSEGRNLLFLTTLGTNSNDFKRLEAFLAECSRALGRNMRTDRHSLMFQAVNSGKNIYNPRVIFYKEKELVRLAEAAGRVAAQPVSQTPPGVPLILPGELITKELIDCISQNQSAELAGLSVRNNDFFISVAK